MGLRFGYRTFAASLAWLSVVLPAAPLAAEQPDAAEILIRVLPDALNTNRAPFRLGLQVGLQDEAGNPLRAERLNMDALVVDSRLSLTTARHPETGRRVFTVANGDQSPHSVALPTRPLRRGVGYTARVKCRCVEGKASLGFAFSPVGGDAGDAVQKHVSVRGAAGAEKAFKVTPQSDGAFQCAFEIAAASTLAFESISLLPDDAEAGWDHEVLEALRLAAPGEMHWPMQPGMGFYNWYDGVGPWSQRRAAMAAAKAEEGRVFGTAEFVAFSRLVGAEPVIRVSVMQPGQRDERIPDLAAAAQLAGDWVAYCNATGRHPLAVLRERHGHPLPLNVRRWDLAAADGGAPSPEVCAAYLSAMKAEDPGADVRVGLALLGHVRDRYVAKVMGRLEAASVEERAYYSDWFTTLSMIYAGVERVRRGPCGDVCTAFRPEGLLYNVPYAKSMLAEAGLALAMFNRYPAEIPLRTEGGPLDEDAFFRVQAALTEEGKALVVWVYNSAPDARNVRLDLTGLKRHFVFWVADQLAGDIAARRTRPALPVKRVQKAGAALTQVVVCEAAPCSFTRVLVKE